MSEENEFITVYAGDTVAANSIKGLLEDAQITVFLKDEVLGSVAPFYASPGGAGAIKVTVLKKDLKKAKNIIKEFENRISDLENE